jgi:hypothetical protein
MEEGERMNVRDVRKKSLAREFLVRAAILTIVFIGLHIFGCRRFTSCLCGTLEAEGMMRHISAFLGLMYVFFYISFTVIVPVLILGSGLLWTRSKLLAGNNEDISLNA